MFLRTVNIYKDIRRKMVGGTEYMCGRTIGSMTYTRGKMPPLNERNACFDLIEEYDSFDNWIHIDTILIDDVSHRGKGHGKRFLKGFINSIDDNTCLITVETGDYDDALNVQFEGDTYRHMKALTDFYKDCGFVDVGGAFGADFGVMIYCNERGEKVIANIGVSHHQVCCG